MSKNLLVVLAMLTLAGCSRTYVYAESECRVEEQREDGTLVMVCYDKSLKKDSRREPKETKP